MKVKHLKELPDHAIVLAEGELNWNRIERVSDRYGTVRIFVPSTESPASQIKRKYLGQHGTLVVKVVEPRESTHCGDWARNIRPKTPERNDIFVLGTGTLFMEENNHYEDIGVKPDSGKQSDWLNPYALYNVHESVVRLIWIKDV